MNWSNEQLLQWSLAAKQKEEDRQLLLDYERVDTLKLRELRKAVDEANQAAVDAAQGELQRLDDRVVRAAGVVRAAEPRVQGGVREKDARHRRLGGDAWAACTAGTSG